MNLNVLAMLAGGLLNVGLVLLLAPLLDGVMRKLTARIQSRQGPPLLQPYFDLLKLLGKDDFEAGVSPGMQRFAAYLALAAVLSAACFVPMGMPAPLNSAADTLVLIYVLTLCGIATLLAGLAAGSTYSLLGINREMMSHITLEPLFAITLIIGIIHTRSVRLGEVLNGSVYTAVNFPWSGLLMLGVMAFSFQAFVNRVPFDITEAETELMEGPLMEYSGPKLALFRWAQMAKLLIYSALFIALFAPWGSSWWFPLNWIAFWAKVVILVILVTLVAATHARYRIDQAIRYYAGLMVVSFISLVLAAFGS